MLDFITTMTGHLVWPAMVLYILISFRQELVALIHRLEKTSSPLGDFEFSTLAAQKIQESDAPVGTAAGDDRQAEEFVLREAYDLLDASPNAAIYLAWNILSRTAMDTLGRVLNREVQAHGLAISKTLHQNAVLEEADAFVFEELRQLRNKVLASEPLAVPQNTAEEYVILADVLTTKLSRNRPE